MKHNTAPYLIVLISLLTLTPALARENESGRDSGPRHHAAVQTVVRSVSTSRQAEPRNDRGQDGHQEPGDDHGRHGGGHH